MDDQPAFRQRVQWHVSSALKFLDFDLADIGHGAQLRVVRQSQLLDMAFTIVPRKYSIHAHRPPPRFVIMRFESGLVFMAVLLCQIRNRLE